MQKIKKQEAKIKELGGQVDDTKEEEEVINVPMIETEPNKNDAGLKILDSQIIQSLRTIKKLGNGASGIVYEVVQKGDINNSIYVLKVMNQPDSSKMPNFIAEYEMLQMLNHPNVLKTYGIFLSDESNPPSILLERCINDLDHAIREKSLSNVQIIYSIVQIAEGMKYIHFRNIIHRDLKPSNILIAADGTIKICDFGISKLMSVQEQQSTMTCGLGTLFFMAPEIVNGDNYDEKVDVYSFGVLVYFILSGGETPKNTIKQFFQGRKAEIPSSFSESARKLISSCWNADPKSRPSFKIICKYLIKFKNDFIHLSEAEKQQVQKIFKEYGKLIPTYE